MHQVGNLCASDGGDEESEPIEQAGEVQPEIIETVLPDVLETSELTVSDSIAADAPESVKLEAVDVLTGDLTGDSREVIDVAKDYQIAPDLPDVGDNGQPDVAGDDHMAASEVGADLATGGGGGGDAARN